MKVPHVYFSFFDQLELILQVCKQSTKIKKTNVEEYSSNRNKRPQNCLDFSQEYNIERKKLRWGCVLKVK